MLDQLLTKLYEFHSDARSIHLAVKSATVYHGVLTLDISDQLIKERIDCKIGKDILRLAKEIDPSITRLETVYATVW